MSDQNARLYARALLEALVGDWQRQLRSLAQRLGNPGLASAEEQTRAVDAALPPNAPPMLRNFLLTLVQNNDLRMLPQVADALGGVAGLEHGNTTAEITSAVALTAEQQQNIEQQLRERHGRSFDVRYTVDPAILGGLIIRVGDQVIDSSVRTRLAALHRQMVGG